MNVKYLAVPLLAALLAGCTATTPFEPLSNLSASNADVEDPPHPPVVPEPPDEDQGPIPRPLPPIEKGPGHTDRPLAAMSDSDGGLIPHFPMPIDPIPIDKNPRR